MCAVMTSNKILKFSQNNSEVTNYIFLLFIIFNLNNKKLI